MSLEIDFSTLSTDEDWTGALAQIMVYMAQKTEPTEEEMDELQEVLDEYQELLPAQTSFEPLLELAAELATVVMINIVNDSITKIKKRNKELRLLADRLGVQVKKLNDSAHLLETITKQINKAIKVVKGLKQVAENASNPDLSKIDKLSAIIKSLDDIAEIFAV